MLHRFLPVLLVATCSLLASCATVESGDRGASTPFVYRFDETVALPLGQRIHIRSKDAKVVVVGSDRSDVRIRAHFELSSSAAMLQHFQYRIEVRADTGELQVREIRRTGTHRFVFDQKEHAILLEVPRNAHVNIVEEDGACEVTAIAGAVEIRMDDGSVTASDCSGPITVLHDNGRFTQRNCTGTVKVAKR